MTVTHTDLGKLQDQFNRLQDTIDMIVLTVAGQGEHHEFNQLVKQSSKRQLIRRDYQRAAHKHVELRSALAELEADYPNLKKLP